MGVFLVVAGTEEVLVAVAGAIEREGGKARGITSLARLPVELMERPVAGILLELITVTRSSAEEKKATNDLIQLYPHAKFRVTAEGLKIQGRDKSLNQFIRSAQAFQPRTIRRSDRTVIYIGVYVSRTSDFSQYRKTVTLNISSSGCFVYSTDEWRVGDRVWLCFNDRECVISGVVRWWQPWGNNRKMPGIGVAFELSEECDYPDFLKDKTKSLTGD